MTSYDILWRFKQFLTGIMSRNDDEPVEWDTRFVKCSEDKLADLTGWSWHQHDPSRVGNVRLKFKQNWGYKKWYNHELVLVVLVEQQFGCWKNLIGESSRQHGTLLGNWHRPVCSSYSGKGVSSQYLVNTQGIHQQCISQQLSESHSGWYGKAQPRWEARCMQDVLLFRECPSKGNWSAKWKGRWAMNHVSLWIDV